MNYLGLLRFGLLSWEESLFSRNFSQPVKFGKVHFLNKWTSGKMTSFSQQMVLGDFLARIANVTELRSRQACFRAFVLVATLTQDVHNWVSRDQSAIIQGFQVKISRHAGCQLPHIRTVQRLSPALSMVRDARREFASLDSTVETDDWLWSGKLFLYPSSPISAILVYWE